MTAPIVLDAPLHSLRHVHRCHGGRAKVRTSKIETQCHGVSLGVQFLRMWEA